MIDLSQFTKEYIEEEMLSQVDPDMDTREGSMIQTAIAPGAWFLEGMYLLLSKLQENANVQTAAGADLDLITESRGIYRKEATAAVREGTFNVAVTTGSTFKTINNEDSVIFESGDFIRMDGANYVYELTCQTAGIIGNSYVGNILPITAINGLTYAVIGTIIQVGADEETDAALRNRYEESFEVAGFGGNISSYRNTILSIAGVGAVQIYPAWNGGGSVLCSIVDDNYQPAQQALIDAVQTYICPPVNAPSSEGYGMAPIGAEVTITTATTLTLDIDCTIQWDAGHGGASDIQAVEDAIDEYIQSACLTWGDEVTGYTINYNVTVYIARISAAILGVTGVVNVSGVTINGSSSDVVCTETSALQEMPELGTVTIS
jgi:uncharacterized phage protein gp47/JayE